MMDTDNSGSPAPKKDEEEILDLIEEMTHDLGTEEDVILLSAEVPPSGDDDVLDLSEEVLTAEPANKLVADSGKPTAAFDEKEDGDIIVLDMEAPEAGAVEEEPIDLSDEVPDMEYHAENIPELTEAGSLIKEMETDTISLFEEEQVVGDEADNILDLSDDLSLIEKNNSEATPLSEEISASVDDIEDILDLDEEAPSLKDSEIETLSLFDEELEDADDADADLDLDEEAPSLKDSEIETLSLLDEELEVTDDADAVLDLDEETPLREETDSDITSLFDEELVVPGKTDDILNLGDSLSLIEEVDSNVFSLTGKEAVVADAAGDELIKPLGSSPESGATMNEFFSMDDFSLVSGDTPETDRIPGGIAQTGVQHAKDLVQDGFELGEALDAVIDKEMISNHSLATALGQGLGLGLEAQEPAEKSLPGQSDTGVPSVSSEQLEVAIEQVIIRMLGKKIDGLLATAIEKAVTEEIKRLKRLLSEILPES